jgi:tripartite-type tricarboxylate transporter receptor subunit TctC
MPMPARLMRRAFLVVMLGLAAVPLARAEGSYPNKTIRIIVAFSPGSGNDVMARELARLFQEALGQPVIVENRTGAGGVLGTEAVAKAAPDGYTIGLGTSSQLVMNVGLNETLPFDVEKDLAMVGLIGRTPLAMVASVKSPASVKELIAASKAKPGSINYGSGGNGSISHIVAADFAYKAGIVMTHIPYKGNGSALIDLAGGTIDILFDGVPNALSLAGKVRLLAISGDKRHPDAPDVPTFAEAGMPGYEAYTWNCLFVPAGTPPAVIAKLNATLNKALEMPTVRRILIQGGGEVIGPSTPAEAAAFGASERAKWVGFIRNLRVSN